MSVTATDVFSAPRHQNVIKTVFRVRRRDNDVNVITAARRTLSFEHTYARGPIRVSRTHRIPFASSAFGKNMNTTAFHKTAPTGPRRAPYMYRRVSRTPFLVTRTSLCRPDATDRPSTRYAPRCHELVVAGRCLSVATRRSHANDMFTTRNVFIFPGRSVSTRFKPSRCYATISVGTYSSADRPRAHVISRNKTFPRSRPYHHHHYAGVIITLRPYNAFSRADKNIIIRFIVYGL